MYIYITCMHISYVFTYHRYIYPLCINIWYFNGGKSYWELWTRSGLWRVGMAALNSVVKEGPMVRWEASSGSGQRVMQVTGKRPQAESAKGKPGWRLAGGTGMNTRTGGLEETPLHRCLWASGSVSGGGVGDVRSVECVMRQWGMRCSSCRAL